MGGAGVKAEADTSDIIGTTCAFGSGSGSGSGVFTRSDSSLNSGTCSDSKVGRHSGSSTGPGNGTDTFTANTRGLGSGGITGDPSLFCQMSVSGSLSCSD